MELRLIQEQELKEVEEGEADNQTSYPNEGQDEGMEVEVEGQTGDSTTHPPVDLTPFTPLLTQLDGSSSGLKFLKILVSNCKEFTKLLSLLPSSSPQSQALLQKVIKVTGKHIPPHKWEKYLGKLDPSTFSCDGEPFKTFLKGGMKHPKDSEGGWVLIAILRSLLQIPASAGVIPNPILGIQMILGHSGAEGIFLEFHKLKGNRNKKLEEEEALQHGKGYHRPATIDVLEFSNLKRELLGLWKVLVEGYIKGGSGNDGDRKVLENSVPYLMQMYGATLGASDRVIFSILKLYSGKKLRIPLESMPLFGPKCFEASKASANPLYAHSIRANGILASINEVKAFQTGLKFREDDFLGEEEPALEQYYDLRFILPLVCHILDEKNICDVVKVVSFGWIHFIARGLSLSDEGMRNTAFLAFKRLIFNLHLAKGFRLQDVKIWLHFLLGVKNGFIELKETKLPPLLATWMVSAAEVLKQPSDPLYSKVTHFLLAKPTIDLSILPDFTHFFNAEDGTKESRDWILNILLLGLQTKADWAVAKKVPTIKYMCCLFPLERIGTQRTILKILANGASIPEVAHDLVDRHGILLWIANTKIDDRTYYRRELEDIYKNLSLHCPPGEYRDYAFQFVAKRHNWSYIRDSSHNNSTLVDTDETLVQEEVEDDSQLISMSEIMDEIEC